MKVGHKARGLGWVGVTGGGWSVGGREFRVGGGRAGGREGGQ